MNSFPIRGDGLGAFERECAAVIVAAGSSSRMGGVDKQLAELCKKPVILHSVDSFEDIECIIEIIIVASESNIEKINALIHNRQNKKPIKIVRGGKTRVGSVINGINAIKSNCSLVAVHDGARPLVSRTDIEGVISLAQKSGAAILAFRAKDTIKTVKNNVIEGTPDRNFLYHAGTPQVFSLDLYRNIINIAVEDPEDCSRLTAGASDDAGIFEDNGYSVEIFECKYGNIKITTEEDLMIARSILEARLKKKRSFIPIVNKDQTVMFGSVSEKRDFSCMRIGMGYDVHRFAPDRKLILGGVEIPCNEGLLGHSDADVLTHSIMDSLLGALALGDIGKFFPDSNDKYKGADSLKLLGQVMDLVRERGFAVENIDCVIIAEKPKLSDFTDKIRKNIAKICGSGFENISIKATTEEGLGLSGMGIGAKAVCLLKKSDK